MKQSLLSHFPHLVLHRENPVLRDDDDGLPDSCLHGGGVEATMEQKEAVLECLRWLPFSAWFSLLLPAEWDLRAAIYGRSPFEQDGQGREGWQVAAELLVQRLHKAVPLDDAVLLALLRRIRRDHWVVSVASGERANQLRRALSALVPPHLLPSDGLYFLVGCGSWDGMFLRWIVEEVIPRSDEERVRVLALAVIYSCHGEPWPASGEVWNHQGERVLGDPKSRFATLRKKWYRAICARAESRGLEANALLYKELCSAVLDAAREGVVQGPPRSRKEKWEYDRFPAALRNAVHRRLFTRLFRERAGRRIQPTRHLQSRLALLPPRKRQRCRVEMRARLDRRAYRLFEGVFVRGDRIGVVARQLGMSQENARKILQRKVRPALRGWLAVREAKQPGTKDAEQAQPGLTRANAFCEAGPRSRTTTNH